MLDFGDVDGATNRAYYSMFDAARAALLASNAPVTDDVGRSHSAVISAFGQHVAAKELVPKEFGRQLNRAHEIRLIADYNGQSVSLDEARSVVSRAEEFLTTIRCLVDKAAERQDEAQGPDSQPGAGQSGPDDHDQQPADLERSREDRDAGV